MSFYSIKRQTSIWLKEEDRKILEGLAEKYGTSRSRLVEALLRKEALSKGDLRIQEQ